MISSNTLQKYKISVFGELYTLMSDDSQEHVNAVALFVDRLMRESAQQAQLVDSKRIAVLVALQLASRLHHLEASLEHKNQKHSKLVSLIEQELAPLTR